ncbi:hypothetical protein LDO32_08795 [Luteimonas sp. Y-2-2-4F]|nr:hypothetical protein [Luteimonas sp. Y-2-2-4F]MCD9031609.1 hypothetical protein [Luteimonas sp. Y-2-2-4F]MCD9031816.1 hypothetical protein [Luteimonas sp. Y-2-2-4F]
MTSKLAFDVSPGEADALLNALNYFAHAVDEDECRTLTGLAQEDLRALFFRLKRLRGE